MVDRPGLWIRKVTARSINMADGPMALISPDHTVKGLAGGHGGWSSDTYLQEAAQMKSGARTIADGARALVGCNLWPRRLAVFGRNLVASKYAAMPLDNACS
jgi:hypothetical protein